VAVIATEIVERIVKADPDALLVAALGTATSAVREVTGDGPHVTIAGAMGCAMAVALGLADAQTGPVVAVVGDGELLMGASSLWSLAGIHPTNLAVVVLADGEYSITGGQPLGTPCRAAAVATALGLHAAVATTGDELDAALAKERPLVVEAVVSQRVWPGPSPFVDPHKVRLDVQARLHAAGSP
jgi:thiamine pyrophosphate-dependent acetolactate synthase large subunit-like protein